MLDVLEEVRRERAAQDAKFGRQDHPDGTGGAWASFNAMEARQACDHLFQRGEGDWHAILREEFFEAMAESDPAELRRELIQVAAVAVAWVEAIDRRGNA